MNVGQFVTQPGDRLDLLDAKLFKKMKKGEFVTGKMLACRQVKSPKFHGLAMDFKNGKRKFSFLARFDRFDIGALVMQGDSDETDDWLGNTFKFVTNKSSQGQTFVNVWNPKSKKASNARKK